MTHKERRVLMGQLLAILILQNMLGQKLDIVRACKTLGLRAQDVSGIRTCFADLYGQLKGQ